MKTIYKYEIIGSPAEISMPEGAKILTVAAQGNSLYLWAEVETRREMEQTRIEVFGTGHEIPETTGGKRIYLGTAFMGGLVWHVYERPYSAAELFD